MFVGGFSQGCALALGLAYSNSHRLEGQLVGAMCFSGYIVQQPIQLAAVRRIPLLWVHNPDDQAISFDHPGKCARAHARAAPFAGIDRGAT